MCSHRRELAVVQTGSSQPSIIKFKAKRLDEVKVRISVGAEPDDVAGIACDLRLVEQDVKRHL